jgi:bacterioferritin
MASITREQLIKRLNEDLAREYQAIIAYVVYSQVLKGAEYMNIAKELEVHAGEELQHALRIAKHIDYLGGMPSATSLPVKLTEDAEAMLRAGSGERERHRSCTRARQECEALSEFAIAEDIREITASGAGAPDRSSDGLWARTFPTCRASGDGESTPRGS